MASGQSTPAARRDLVPGTLEMLLLKTLSLGPLHGYGIALNIQRLSRDVLQVEEGSLYPALQRLEQRGLIDNEWLTTENNRRAKYYRLTTAGRRAVNAETAQWKRYVKAVELILDMT